MCACFLSFFLSCRRRRRRHSGAGGAIKQTNPIDPAPKLTIPHRTPNHPTHQIDPAVDRAIAEHVIRAHSYRRPGADPMAPERLTAGPVEASSSTNVSPSVSWALSWIGLDGLSIMRGGSVSWAVDGLGLACR